MPRKPKTKKVLVLLGSPRKKGNNTILAEQIIKGAEAAGASIERIYLHGQNISPCHACYRKKTGSIYQEGET
jgi:multimeric flavodoxin WrbA